MFVDTHAHLFENSFDDLEIVIGRATENGVENVIVPSVDLESAIIAIGLQQKYPGFVRVAVGIHPESLIRGEIDLNEASHEIEKIAREAGVVAIGEIGVDFSRADLESIVDEQRELMLLQSEIAKRLDLPVIVHTRDTVGEALEILDSVDKKMRGVFHCFSGSEEELEMVIGRGFYVSFCGNITWSKRVRKLVPQVPEDRILFETDSPYMAPRDEKGDVIGRTLRNEPGNVRILAQIQAELRGDELDNFASTVRENTSRLFGV